MKTVLAFDSFKGSLTAAQVVSAVSDAIRHVHHDAEIVALPLADGGEGTAEALCRCTDATWVECAAHDALMRPITARYAISRDRRTAIMEMAEAAGLTLLAETERNPMRTTTVGVGEMMKDAIERGARHIIIGIGGSATNDCGMGMLTALGAVCRDACGNVLPPIGANMTRLGCMDWSRLLLPHDLTIEVVCDVSNPLFGTDGAAHVYARQKGASEAEVQHLDAGLRHMAATLHTSPVTGQAIDANGSGCGAAGGLGYALLLLGARLRRGVDVVLDAAHIDSQLLNADLCMTGEGRIDSQTLNGKLPYGVLLRAQKHGVPVMAFAGAAADCPMLQAAGFSSITAITPPTLALSQAMRPDVATRLLRQAVTTALLTQSHSL